MQKYYSVSVLWFSLHGYTEGQFHSPPVYIVDEIKDILKIFKETSNFCVKWRVSEMCIPVFPPQELVGDRVEQSGKRGGKTEAQMEEANE